MNSKKLWLGFFILIPVISQGIFLTANHEKPNKDENRVPTPSSQYWEVGPFKIDDSGSTGNGTWMGWAVLQPWCTGIGSEANPFVIQNLSINGKWQDICIEIRESDAHFTLKNCILYNSKSVYYSLGVFANNSYIFNNTVINNKGTGIQGSGFNHVIEHNFVYNNSIGILMGNNPGNTGNITIIENTVIKCTPYGIDTRYCLINNITSNYIEDCEDGISLFLTHNATIFNNTIVNTKSDGIQLGYSDYNNLTENKIIKADTGISLTASDYNRVINNTLTCYNTSIVEKLCTPGTNVIKDNTYLPCPEEKEKKKDEDETEPLDLLGLLLSPIGIAIIIAGASMVVLLTFLKKRKGTERVKPARTEVEWQ